MDLKQSVKQRLQRGNPEVEQLRREVKQLRQRVRAMSEDIQESRRLQERVAELTDVVAELLVPAMDRDDERVRSAIETFNRNSS